MAVPTTISRPTLAGSYSIFSKTWVGDDDEHARCNAAGRLARQQHERTSRTGTGELFTVEQTMEGGFRSYTAEREARLVEALALLRAVLDERRSIPWDEALTSLLEIPLVWDKDVKAIVNAEQDAGRLMIRGLKEKERVPKLGQGHVLVVKAKV